MRGSVLVTGGAGFIGSHIAKRLVHEGADVRVFDDFSTGFRANLAEVDGDVEIIEGDVRNRDALDRAVRGCQYVIHEAALGSVPRSIDDPVTSHDVNAGGTLNVLLAARGAGVERVVYASSSSVYGDSPSDIRHESDCIVPLSPYAIAKYAGEAYCGVFARLYGLETVALRYFNVFGPFQDPASQYAAVIPKFISAALTTQPITVCGTGEQTRDFTFVDNVVDANLLALTTPAERAVHHGGGVYNIACGGSISVLELADEIRRRIPTSGTLDFIPARPGEVACSQAAIDRAAMYLGFAPRVGFAEGLDRTIAHLSARV